MKMKKACEATALTERAVRLYISKGLITPRQQEGLIDFSPEDIQLLQDIALLRRMDFTMEQIAGMQRRAEDIPAILAARMDAARAGAAHEQEVLSLLDGLAQERCTSLRGVADGIRACRITPEPDFARFDELSEEVRQQETLQASAAVDRQQRRQRALCWLVAAGVLVAVVAAVALVFLGSTRLEGYIAVSPVTVEAVQGNYAAIRIGNAQTADLLGRDALTVPYRCYGKALAAGDSYDNGCQLVIRLTNLDLLRMGINPQQNFRTRYEQVNAAWLRTILQALFAEGGSDHATLWVHETAAVPPLLSPTD